MINDTDKLLVNDGSKTETVTFQELAESLSTDTPPVINTVTLFEDNPTGSRFTNTSFTTTVVMEDDGEPPSDKSIRGTVGSDIKYKFGPISSVNSEPVIYSAPANFTSPNSTIRTPGNAFNNNFGVSGNKEDFNFANTDTQGVGKELKFVFPEPLFVSAGVDVALGVERLDTVTIKYKINGVTYTESIAPQGDGHVGPGNNYNTIPLNGGLIAELFFIDITDDTKNQEAYGKYLEPYLVNNANKCKMTSIVSIKGPFEFLETNGISNGEYARGKLFGVWLGNSWLDDNKGVTELFFDDTQTSNVARVITGDDLYEIGNGDDAIGTVAFTQFIGDELGSIQNKISLSKIESNWDAGSDVASPADTTLQYLVLDNDLNVTALQATETDFTPFTGTAPQIKFGSNLGTLGTPDNVLPDGTSIQTKVKAANGIVPDSTKESNSITPGTSVFTPLYLENPEDVSKFNAIKESLDGYQSNRLNFRAELRKRLVENEFTMKDIYNLGLLKNEDATAWSVDTGYNQGSLVSYNDEYWFALSSSYNNSPDDNDPLDWEDINLQQ